MQNRSAPTFVLAGILVLTDIPFALPAQGIRCDCSFDRNSEAAVGTDVACSAMTKVGPDRKTELCEFSFGGIGFDGEIAAKYIVPDEYERLAFQVTLRNLDAVYNHRTSLVASPEYLRVAIPAYMRALYFRRSAGLDDRTIRDLDIQIQKISALYSEQIAEVFDGRRQPFTQSWRDRDLFEVEPGAIQFIYGSTIKLSAIFFR